MQNIWRNIAGRRLGARARSYSSMPQNPDQVSTPAMDRASRFLEGSFVLVVTASAGYLLYDAVLNRIWRKSGAARDPELERKLQLMKANHLAWKKKMNEARLASPPEDYHVARDA